MDAPLTLRTPTELLYYLRVAPCARCEHGPLQLREPADQWHRGKPDRAADVRVCCAHCGQVTTLAVRWDRDAGDDPEECINPAERPSEAVDLAQWVSLYYLFAEQADAADTPAGTRRAAGRARLCLAEALKFYDDGELPPETALFSESSRAAFEANPANYARTRLRELQAMLPVPMPGHAHADAPDAAAADRPWWKFW